MHTHHWVESFDPLCSTLLFYCVCAYLRFILQTIRFVFWKYPCLLKNTKPRTNPADTTKSPPFPIWENKQTKPLQCMEVLADILTSALLLCSSSSRASKGYSLRQKNSQIFQTAVNLWFKECLIAECFCA